MTGPRAPLFSSTRPRRARRLARVFLVAAAGAAVVLGLSGALLWWYANHKLERIDIPTLAENAESGLDDPIPGTLNVLIVGTDSREGLSEQQLLELGTEEVDGARTDTIMLVQVSPVRERAVVVSFPRDLRVDPPGQSPGKINGVHARAGANGPDVLVRTVQEYTGVIIDHYVEVNLAGFLLLADTLGGVEVCLEDRMVDEFAAVDLDAGCHRLDGIGAAGFVRARHVEDSFGFGDFGRVARQQYFIRQSMKQVTSAGTLLNPLKLKSLIDVVATAVKTDRDLGAAQMYRLADALKHLGQEDVEQRMVPSYWDSPYAWPYPERAEALFQSLREGTAIPDVGLTEPRELVADDVRVTVLNGVGREGLASQMESYLEARAFDVVEVTNGSAFGVQTTLIAYGPDGEVKAQLLANFLPGARLEQRADIPEGSDIVLTVGEDWGGT